MRGVKKKVVVIKIWGKKKSGGKTDWKKNGGVKKGGVKNCGHKKCDKISQKLISKIWTRPKTRSLRRPLKLEVPLKKMGAHKIGRTMNHFGDIY